MKVNLLLSGSGQIAVLPALSGTFRLSLHHRKQGRMLNKLLSPFLASRQIPTPSPIDVYLVMGIISPPFLQLVRICVAAYQDWVGASWCNSHIRQRKGISTKALYFIGGNSQLGWA